MPVFGVAAKLRHGPIGSQPAHTVHTIPNFGTSGTQQYLSKSLELSRTENSMISCQIMLQSTSDFGEVKALPGKGKDTQDSKVSSEFYLQIGTLERVA